MLQNKRTQLNESYLRTQRLEIFNVLKDLQIIKKLINKIFLHTKVMHLMNSQNIIYP